MKSRIARAAFALTLAAAAVIGTPQRAHPATGPAVAHLVVNRAYTLPTVLP
ncbi:hypothetical protein [Streptomyces bluensis]|uniref:Uncharacterized protein n=1 Tax=Streptomyces bluensis TaxID=33897 RepID=A0ABW6UTY2_9ACTN